MEETEKPQPKPRLYHRNHKRLKIEVDAYRSMVYVLAPGVIIELEPKDLTNALLSLASYNARNR